LRKGGVGAGARAAAARARAVAAAALARPCGVCGVCGPAQPTGLNLHFAECPPIWHSAKVFYFFLILC